MTDHSPDPTDRDPHRTLEAEVAIHAEPGQVWAVVSDVRRTGEWSPECRRVIARGPVREGSTFVGVNQRGPVVWPTRCRVTVLDPERQISFRVMESGATWTYTLERIPEGTRLTERRDHSGVDTRLGRFFSNRLLGGAVEHTDELADGMRYSLRRIKDIVESASGPAGPTAL